MIAMNAQPSPIHVYIDRVKYQHRPGPVTPAQIREIPTPSVPADKDVWLDIVDALDRRLEEGDSVDLVEGMHFFTELRPISVVIDRASYEVYERKLTGAQLRALPSPDVAADRDLWLDVPDARDRKVQDEDVVALKDGVRFFSAPGRINPGRGNSTAAEGAPGSDAAAVGR
jgi:hypothetical protein